MLLLPGCLFRAARGEPPLVGRISVEGNRALTTGDITDRLALSESGYRVVARFGEENVFDAQTVSVDIKRIERLYAARGYFDARVVDVRTAEDAGRMNVTFVVQEGAPSSVVALDIGGLEGLSAQERRALTADLPLARGAAFDEGRYDAAKSLLRERLRGEGYAEADVQGSVSVDRGAAKVRVRLEVTPGLRYRVARVHVFGAQTISRTRIAEASGLKEGSLYTPRAMSNAQKRIYGLGVFGQVQVDPGPYNRRDATVPVILTVSEAPFITWQAGAGLEVDSLRDLARGRLLWTHRNVAGGLQKLTLGGSAGYAFVPSAFAYFSGGDVAGQHGLVADVGAELVQPRVARSPFDLALAADYTKDLTQAFAYQRLGLRVGSPFRFDSVAGLSIAPSLNFERYFRVAVTTLNQPGAGQNVLTTSGCGPAKNGEAADTCDILFAELNVNYDRRDDAIAPRRGYFLSTNLRYAGLGLSDFNYLRISPEARGYVPLSRQLTLATRVHYGYLEKLGGREPPGIAHFFAGGATSVRTSGAQQLGPRNFQVVQNPKYDARKPGSAEFAAGAPVPIGGDRLLEGSAELRWMVGSTGVELGLFFDVGALSLGHAGAGPSATGWQYGPGVGVRYHTPFGPLRADFAWRLSDLNPTPSDVQLNLPNDAAIKRYGDYSRQHPGKHVFATSCAGASSPYCYKDGRFQFFLTLGNAF